MRKLQKTLAVLIALLVVCGLPFSVQAVGTGKEPLAVVQALAVPNYIAQAANLPADRSVMLCFNKDVTLDTTTATRARVGFGIVVGQDGNDYGTAYGNCVLGGVSGNSIRPDATMAVTTALSTTKNNIVVTLPEGFTVSELFEKCAEKNGTGSKFRVVLRLYDYKRGADDFIDGISYVDGDNTVKLTARNNETHFGCQSNANLALNQPKSNTFDMYDIPIITEDDALTLKSAKWVADDKVTVTFSQPVSVRKSGSSNDIYSGIRLVNSKGQIMRYREGDSQGVKYYINARDTGTNTTLSASEDLQAAVNLANGQSVHTATIPANQKAKLAIDGFDAGSLKTLSWFNAHLQACQAEHPDEVFQIVYLVQENTVYADRCEGKSNWYISGLYGSNSGLPLIATNNKKTGGDDVDLAVIKTTAAIDVDGLYYADMASAATYAKANSKITLLDNVTVTKEVEVGSGVTLDLNGKTLDVTGSGLSALNATVVDGDGKAGTGLLKAAAENEVFLNKGNTQLPLYDAANGGYRFYEYQFMGKTRTDAPTNAWRYAVRLALPTAEAYALLAQEANQDMVGVDLQLLNADGSENNKVPCKFASKTMSEYAEASQDLTAKKAIVFTVYGKEAVEENGLTLASAPSLSSITGVRLTPDWQ